MSLLDSGNELVTVFVEQATTDSDGNPVMEPAPVGVDVIARVQPINNIASSESHALGQELNTRYRLRVSRQTDVPYGPWSAVEWRGDRYEVLGEPEIHSGSVRTRHITAVMRRA